MKITELFKSALDNLNNNYFVAATGNMDKIVDLFNQYLISKKSKNLPVPVFLTEMQYKLSKLYDDIVYTRDETKQTIIQKIEALKENSIIKAADIYLNTLANTQSINQTTPFWNQMLDIQKYYDRPQSKKPFVITTALISPAMVLTY